MYKTYKFKLYSSKRNKKLKQEIRICSNIYNHCIALHRKYYKLTGKHLNAFRLAKHVAKLKKLSKYSFWNQINSQAIQNIVERIELSYKAFFKNTRNYSGKKVGIPSFRKASKYKSFTLKQCGYKLLDGNKIKIHKTTYKYFKSREVIGKIKTVTLKVDKLGDLYVYFVCDLEGFSVVSSVTPMTGKSAGFDFGLKTFLTSSDGIGIESPTFFADNIKSVRKANRLLSRKQKGSNARRKAKRDLAKLHLKIANKRQDFHRKLAKSLVNTYDFLFFENLNINGMKRLWGKKISDLSFSSFLLYLESKCESVGKKLVKIGKFFPSSKTCSNCGCVNSSMDFKDLRYRIWSCPDCGTLLHRDFNAALNIKREGIKCL